MLGDLDCPVFALKHTKKGFVCTLRFNDGKAQGRAFARTEPCATSTEAEDIMIAFLGDLKESERIQRNPARS